ncbi:hypothetical protein [Phycicoccus sonneratiae]|uniref:Integral membrane protein n=1 Tax=Phycicoccus sonneratiae TaxID=2807628 RepID=A0ABS2CJB3_9MICO|nr:hypothetical protein [Phycicoccus sonneraticus]MBM6399978.1 hypothetical protein [Phycicoccus sonneraticus]
MSPTTRRRLTGALALELLAVGVLAGVGPEFPRGGSPASGWDALLHDGVAAAHAGLGVVIAVQALVLLLLPRPRTFVALAAVAAVVAAGAGAWYIGGGQEDAPLMAMTVGWVVATLAALVAWVQQRRDRVAGTPIGPVAGESRH